MSLFKQTLYFLVVFLCALSFSTVSTSEVHAQIIATTTLNISVCGNNLVDIGEDCDSPGETGAYSTTIAGRQCDVDCSFGPYCGDGILQISHSEECDDGNNDSGDFCSATCTIEPAGSGGGGSSGGGTASGGGSNDELGDTQINVTGRAYPSETLNILLDGSEVGTVRSSSDGYFDFATDANPGTVSMGFWSLDKNNNRSITFNTTFDVTQGAVTNISGILLPPTLVVEDATINPGDTLVLSGQAIPEADIEVHFNDSDTVVPAVADSKGEWALSYSTESMSAAEYTIRARYLLKNGSFTTNSSFSSALQLFLGVDGEPTTPSDLNRDGSVGLIDFSILLFWWQTNGGDSDPPADINGNGNVGLEDFSILLFNWTG